MRVAILGCGAIVVREKEQEWLFGAPVGIKDELEKIGLEVPKYIFTTKLRSPGIGNLGPRVIFKEEPLRLNGFSATPVPHRHGTDYIIDSGDARILFSERGDVSSEDVNGFHLAIIKNKHRSDKFDDKVITWPWPDTEVIIKNSTIYPIEESIKEWSSIEDIPSNLKKIDDVSLTVPQANFIAKIAKSTAEEEDDENWAIGISAFKKAYKKDGDKWVKAEIVEKEKIDPVKKSDDKEDELIVVADSESVKEYDEGKPIPRILDILTADLHKAYNDCSDKLFKTGYLSQDERMKIASAIGSGLKAFRTDLSNEEFSTRRVNLYDMGNSHKEFLILKELIPNIPDNIDEYWSTVYKDDKQIERWATISSVAVWDRQDELFTTKAMDWAINFAKLINYKGPLRFRHVPGLDGGDCDTQVRVGDFLFESGTFRDTPMGRKLKSKIKDPEYRISLGLAYAKEDIINNAYKRAAIFERSLTKQPAVPVTSVITYKEDITMNILTEAELKDIASELDMDYSEVKEMYEDALTGKKHPLALKEFKEVVYKAANNGGATVALDDDDEEDEEEMEYTKKDMKDILSNLSSEEFQSLKEMVAEVDIETSHKDESEDKVTQLESLISQQGNLILEQTKAMQGLANALVGNQTNSGANQAVAEFLQQVPRNKANQFVSTTTKSQTPVGGVDESVLLKLKEIEESLKDIKSPGVNSVYDQFTSRSLNRG